MNKLSLQSLCRRRILWSWTFALALASALVGCSVLKPAEDQTRYYLLASASPPAEGPRTNSVSKGIVVRVRPVELAGYLRTKDMVVRTGTNEVSFAMFHRWAAPLDSAIRAALANGLRANPAVQDVLTDEPSPSQGRVYTLSVQVTACEGRISNQHGSVVFRAAWEITTPDPGREILAQGVFRARPMSWEPGDYAALAAELSKAVGDFSAVLTQALFQAAARTPS
jgi:uncharacterized lipoprotein YmbA